MRNPTMVFQYQKRRRNKLVDAAFRYRSEAAPSSLPVAGLLPRVHDTN